MRKRAYPDCSETLTREELSRPFALGEVDHEPLEPVRRTAVVVSEEALGDAIVIDVREVAYEAPGRRVHVWPQAGRLA